MNTLPEYLSHIPTNAENLQLAYPSVGTARAATAHRQLSQP
jgi:hypothetical protein